VQDRERDILVRLPDSGLATKQPARVRRCTVEERSLPIAIRPSENRLEELAHDAERERSLELAPPCLQHGEPGSARAATPLGEERGLADTGRTLDHQYAPFRTQRSRDRSVQHGQLLCPLEQQLRHSRRPASAVNR
jgi:hypothetical protein